MRYYELLVEYKTDITKGKYGQNIINKLGFDLVGTEEALKVRDNDWTLKCLDDMGVLDIDSVYGGLDDLEEGGIGKALYDGLGNIGEGLTPQDRNAVLDNILLMFEEIDPTTNKQYTQQIVKWFLKSANLASDFPNWEDARSTFKESLYYFQKLRERIPEEYRDIGKYKNPKEFMNTVQGLREKYGKKEDQMDKGQHEMIYTSDFVNVYWPIDEKAACYLGQGTQWCTSATRSENAFNGYNQRGPLVIFNFKKPVTLGDAFTLEPSDVTVDKIQMSLTVTGDNWKISQIADVRDGWVDFDELYVDENFHAMWNDLKFQSALGKVTDAWKINRESLK